MARVRRACLAVLLTASLTLLGAASTRAEISAHGDLFVNFSGAIAPSALPRQERVPVAVSVAGTVRTLSGARPPALSQFGIEINQGGRLDTRGLPVCHRSQIQPSSTREALARCGAALVGGGAYEADVAFPEQSSFPSQGRVLAFNTRIGGREAILAHVYGTDPAPTTRTIVFRIRRHAGTFGTTLTASLPESANGWGYLTYFSLELHRTFTFRGRQRSYLSAACGAPAGFQRAIFPFARTTMTFTDGRTLNATLTRSCRVRE